ncbi:Rieske (2Fe-2S) protein [Corynebacterium guangdongense]|uniref:Nitrite reductase/ring-hydroxylating ferredoxin subunit n=1 Tax=Corynebacterium guangdongense TaxID=1783348 RepID=A0ABU2A3B6_9CORY|nr:Rieske (2Fe-2S) protein [Corynebacterium guangdongense]MDR7330573.1 nitrite reductase/ring-hydroxylating ferredoxin subunit [Corynebacterium guangdongense]
MSEFPNLSCSRRMFLLGTASTFASAFLVGCGTAPSEEVAATQVPVGSAVIVGDVIIAQPTAGNFVAYSTSCPHQGNKITQVNDGTVTCTAHNSVFDIADGSVLDGPSRDPLAAGKATVDGGTVTATA